MKIEVSDGQFENADSSSNESWLPDSTETVESAPQSETQKREIVSRELGRQSDVSDEQPRNACAPRNDSLLSDSNAIVKRLLQ
jgi:hypothetical protein